MRRLTGLIALFAVLIGSGWGASSASSDAASAPANEDADREAALPEVAVLFTPADDCIQAVVNEIDTARTSVRVHSLMLTGEAVARALIRAQDRGVDVWVLLDAANARGPASQASGLQVAGVVVKIDPKPERAHQNVIIIDRETVLTGSFDFSERSQAERADNLLIFKRDSRVSKSFNVNWASRMREGVRFDPDAFVPAKDAVKEQVAGGGPAKPAPRGVADKIYATRFGKRYHRKDCVHAQSGATEIDRVTAKSRGLSPCRVCRPDTP